jgi:hypothetical protein
VILIGVSLALLVAVLLLSPSTIVDLATSLGDTSLVVRLPLAVIIIVIILALVYLLLRGERIRKDEGLHVRAGGALADVSIDSARMRILKAVREVRGVVSSDAQVRALRGKADVEVDVVITSDNTDIPAKHKEIDRALNQVINKQLGLRMAGKPKVHLRFEHEGTVAQKVETKAEIPPITVLQEQKPAAVLITEQSKEVTPPIGEEISIDEKVDEVVVLERPVNRDIDDMPATSEILGNVSEDEKSNGEETE